MLPTTSPQTRTATAHSVGFQSPVFPSWAKRANAPLTCHSWTIHAAVSRIVPRAHAADVQLQPAHALGLTFARRLKIRVLDRMVWQRRDPLLGLREHLSRHSEHLLPYSP
jgi:hypothetical protein